MNCTNVTVLSFRSAMSFIDYDPAVLPATRGETELLVEREDGIIYTNPNKKHSEGYRVFDWYESDEPEYLGWALNWIEALVIYHTRVKDTDGECCVMILRCRTTELPCLWGKVALYPTDEEEEKEKEYAEIELLSRLH